MLKLIVLIFLTAFGVFLFACLALAGLMFLIVLTMPKEPEADAAVRRRVSDVAPVQDDLLFSRIAREAMAYATRPYVTTIIDAQGDFLLSTVSDAFGRRVYAESKRRVSKTLVAVLCVYTDGRMSPDVAVSTEVPATQVDWSAHFNAISDVAANGPKMSFIDGSGRRREIRIPKERRHHA